MQLNIKFNVNGKKPSSLVLLLKTNLSKEFGNKPTTFILLFLEQ